MASGRSCGYGLCGHSRYVPLAGYVINDAIDIEADRGHRTKCLRPLASGDLPILVAPFMILGLLSVSFGLAIGVLSTGFVAMLAAYLVATLSYSLYLKKLLLLDVLVLAGLYTHQSSRAAWRRAST